MAENKHTILRIEKLPRGGYAVLTSYPPDFCNCALAAFSEIDDALAFIKDELDGPEKVGESPMCNCSARPGQLHTRWCPMFLSGGERKVPKEKVEAKPTIVTADVTEKVKETFPPLPERGRYRGIV